LAKDRLTPLQRDLLRAFFEKERGFYLTGGAALAGFYVAHRATTDLDLFTLEDEAFERGRKSLEAAVTALKGTLTVKQHVPGFHRYLVQRGDEAVVVDLVRERVPQCYGEKIERDGIRIDPLDEILANKLTTVLSRAEARDLVDLLVLEQAGHRVEQALPAALAKDGGCTPAALAWVLSQIVIPPDAGLPGNVPGTVLRQYVEELVTRLRRAAAPGGRQ